MTLNGEDKEKTITIDLSWLKNKKLMLIKDGDDRKEFESSEKSSQKIDSIRLKAYGGFILYTI